MKTKTEEIFETTAPYNNFLQGDYVRALFVCSAGLLRSATAATLGSQYGMNTRNCGSSEYALIPLSANLICWADKIFFVNAENYLSAIETFGSSLELSSLLQDKAVVWDIPDNYNYMQPELVEIIEKLLFE